LEFNASLLFNRSKLLPEISRNCSIPGIHLQLKEVVSPDLQKMCRLPIISTEIAVEFSGNNYTVSQKSSHLVTVCSFVKF